MLRAALAFLVALLVAHGTAQRAEQDWYGVDLVSPTDATYSVRIKAEPGDNYHVLVDQFFKQHSSAFQRNEADFNSLVNALEEAGGGKCDACLTFVELLVGYFQQMGLQHSKKVGQDNFGRAERAMHIDNDLERTIGVLCKSPEYLHYAPHIRKGCTDILGDARAPQALRTFQSVTLTPAETVARKSEICVDLYKVCRPATPERRRLSECERCAESMMDLHFVLRRSGRDSSMPFVKGSRLSRKHIITELQELCYDTEHRHPKGEVDGIRESCERLTEEFEEEIVKSFVAREDTGQTLVNPVKSVCVGVTEVCDKAEFEDGFSRLANTPFYKRSGSATENADPAPNFRPPTPMPPSEPSDEL